MITVQVPATTANLGPGFDCFGMALTLYGRFTFEELPAGLRFEGVPEAFCNADNLAVRAYFSALKAINLSQAGLLLAHRVRYSRIAWAGQQRQPDRSRHFCGQRRARLSPFQAANADAGHRTGRASRQCSPGAAGRS